MNHSESFQKIFPFILENIAQEVGDLIGEPLELQDENIIHGSLQKLFSPPKKKFVLTDINLKGNHQDPAHLMMDLEIAVNLGGKLIMLPESEISAYRKLGKLDGEILDAFSEIVNIITGVINSTCQEYIPKNTLYFIKGNPSVLAARSTDLPLPNAPHSLISGSLISEDEKPGIFQLFFPHTLIDDQQADDQQPDDQQPDDQQPDDQQPDDQQKYTQAVAANFFNKEEFFEELPAGQLSPNHSDETAQAGDPGYKEKVGSKDHLGHPETNGTPMEPANDSTETFPSEKSLNIKDVAIFLLESLDSAREELEALLGGSLHFSEQQTRFCPKKDIFGKTRGKQILTKIEISGDKDSEGYVLLPLRDAVFLGATLLLVPPETITQIIKQGKLDEDVADAFGEIVNILVGTYSNRFRTDFPIKLTLKKAAVETLVPSQVDLESSQPFRGDNYYQVSTRLQLEDNMLGPLELFFPADTLGLGKNIDAVDSVEKTTTGKATVKKNGPQLNPEQRPTSSTDANSQTGLSQNIDSVAGVEPQEVPVPVVVAIGQESSQVEVLQNILAEETSEFVYLSEDDDFRQYLNHENLCCVFLFLEKVNEQGFAKIIKIRAMLPVGYPLIVAGPEWTQSMVLKAVKYGATDVLLSPATKKTIQKKCHRHLYNNQG